MSFLTDIFRKKEKKSEPKFSIDLDMHKCSNYEPQPPAYIRDECILQYENKFYAVRRKNVKTFEGVETLLVEIKYITSSDPKDFTSWYIEEIYKENDKFFAKVSLVSLEKKVKEETIPFILPTVIENAMLFTSPYSGKDSNDTVGENEIMAFVDTSDIIDLTGKKIFTYGDTLLLLTKDKTTIEGEEYYVFDKIKFDNTSYIKDDEIPVIYDNNIFSLKFSRSSTFMGKDIPMRIQLMRTIKTEVGWYWKFIEFIEVVDIMKCDSAIMPIFTNPSCTNQKYACKVSDIDKLLKEGE